MPIRDRIIVGFWLIFIVYWAISATRAKRRIRGRSWWVGAWFRALLIMGGIQLQRLPACRALAHDWNHGVAAWNPMIGIAGILLCAAGMVFAFWARRHLGRNWGMPMSLQEGHELVTTGPYAWVRHPIYTGILLAMLGSALAMGAAWIIAFLIFGVYFISSARREESLMREQFPNEYPPYQARTKMLIPWLF